MHAEQSLTWLSLATRVGTHDSHALAYTGGATFTDHACCMQNGAVLDALDLWRRTPLMWALLADNADGAKLLLRRGASTTTKDANVSAAASACLSCRVLCRCCPLRRAAGLDNPKPECSTAVAFYWLAVCRAPPRWICWCPARDVLPIQSCCACWLVEMRHPADCVQTQLQAGWWLARRAWCRVHTCACLQASAGTTAR